jgi:hydroxymethylglutaryl-CoA lyase
MFLPKQVEIVEVGPRDGLQNEPAYIPTEEKLELISELSKTGISRFEVTSFVHPKYVPQMQDAKVVFSKIAERNDFQYLCLVPNMKGYELALQNNVKAVTLVAGASNTFNQKNVRMSTEDSLGQFEKVIEKAHTQKTYIRFAIATSFWCPYEGKVEKEGVLKIIDRLESLEVDEIVICDTIGRANPQQVYDVFSRIMERGPTAKISAHFHDTYGFALANSIAAMQAGITVFDSSIAGLGGCPFAPGAAGNLATEDLVLMLHEMGIETGIDYQKLLLCVDMANRITGKKRIQLARI